MNPVVEEYLYPAIEDFRLDIMIDRGPSARSVRIDLKRFTLIGATTRTGLLTRAAARALRDERAARLLRAGGAGADHPPLRRRSSAFRSTRPAPRSWPRAPAGRRASGIGCCAACATTRETRADGKITQDVARAALELLEVDARGLDDMDRRMLEAIVVKYGGGPVGLTTIAVVVGRGAGNARGRLRAVSDPGRIPEAHRARPRGDRSRLHPPRPYRRPTAAPPRAIRPPRAPKGPKSSGYSAKLAVLGSTPVFRRGEEKDAAGGG